MNIGLDFDGVITNCGNLKSQGAKEIFGVDIPPAKFKKELVVASGLLTYDEYREVQKAVYCNQEYGLKMEAVDGVKEALEQLQQKHEVHIVTSRDSDALEVAKSWLERNSFNIPIVGVGHNVSKAEANQNSNVFVDDDFDKLKELIGTVPNLFLFSWPYNEDIELPLEIQRVSGWDNLLSNIASLK